MKDLDGLRWESRGLPGDRTRKQEMVTFREDMTWVDMHRIGIVMS